MKTTEVVLATMLLAFASKAQGVTPEHSYFTNAAKYGPTVIAMAEKGYANSLKCENEGVVESALAQVTVMKITLPTRAFKGLEAEIAKLVKNACTPELRYKAYLAQVAMQHPEIFTTVSVQSFKNNDELFGEMSNRLISYSSAR